MSAQTNPADAPRAHSLIASDRIAARIFLLRGERVMLDSDLALLYGVPAKQLNQAVKRNGARFPADFMFQLSSEEFEQLRSQNVTSNAPAARGGRRYLPYVFTEQGVAMLSSVLRSRRAIAVNVEIMRTFVRMRKLVVDHADLARKLDALEARYDRQFKVIFDAIRRLMEPAPIDEGSQRRIGFANSAPRVIG